MASTSAAKDQIQQARTEEFAEEQVPRNNANPNQEEEEGEDEAEMNLDDPQFCEGEIVFAYHGPRIYCAKVLKAEVQKEDPRKQEWKFYVHYRGWNKNWDEWVSSDRLLKYTPENVRKQEELESQSADKGFKCRMGQNKPRISADVKVDKDDIKNNVARGKKRKSESEIEEKVGDVPEKLIKIQIPNTLKKQLLDDWEFVTRLGKLVKLPRTPSVDDILKKYLGHKSKKDGVVGDATVEILNGLRSYFDRALPSKLLYKQERQQYSEAVSEINNVAPSSLYGAEHLLRLFVKLPELIMYVNMEEEALIQLQQKLLDFLKFLQKNQSNYFLSNYDGPKVPLEVKKKDQIGS